MIKPIHWFNNTDSGTDIAIIIKDADGHEIERFQAHKVFLRNTSDILKDLIEIFPDLDHITIDVPSSYYKRHIKSILRHCYGADECFVVNSRMINLIKKYQFLYVAYDILTHRNCEPYVWPLYINDLDVLSCMCVRTTFFETPDVGIQHALNTKLLKDFRKQMMQGELKLHHIKQVLERCSPQHMKAMFEGRGETCQDCDVILARLRFDHTKNVEEFKDLLMRINEGYLSAPYRKMYATFAENYLGYAPEEGDKPYVYDLLEWEGEHDMDMDGDEYWGIDLVSDVEAENLFMPSITISSAGEGGALSLDKCSDCLESCWVHDDDIPYELPIEMYPLPVVNVEVHFQIIDEKETVLYSDSFVIKNVKKHAEVYGEVLVSVHEAFKNQPKNARLSLRYQAKMALTV